MLLFMVFTCFTYSQEKYIFFELDSTITFKDTIIFNSKTYSYKRILKVPAKRKIKLELFVGGEEIKFELKRKYLDRYNTISILEESGSSQILIMRGHTHYIFSISSKDSKSSFWKIQIQSHSKWINENNKLMTESIYFNEAIKDNPNFFW